MRTSHFLIVSVIVVCVAAHRPILRALGGGLVVDQEPPPSCTHIVVLGGDKRYDVAAKLIGETPKWKLLHLGGKYSRLVEYHVLPPWEDHFKQQMRERGAPEERIEFRGATLQNSWKTVTELNRWLQEQDDAGVVVLCERFNSRCLRYQLDTILSPEHAARVSLLALPDRRYNEQDWWRSRTGLKQFVYAGIDLAATWWFGPEGEAEDVPRWTPDEYEKQLRLVQDR